MLRIPGTSVKVREALVGNKRKPVIQTDTGLGNVKLTPGQNFGVRHSFLSELRMAFDVKLKYMGGYYQSGKFS